MTDETNENEQTSEQSEGKKRGGKRPPRQEKKPTTVSANGIELEERVVAVNRVAKVVKGGRRFSFAALLIVGDKNGHVGYGLGKAKEVPDAIRKAGMKASKKMITVPMDNGTIPHEILGQFGAGEILLKPAGDGTGIKAAGACRSILELAGIKNVLTKSIRGSNPHNVVKATFQALKELRAKETIAAVRDTDAKKLRMKIKNK
jgi:small subunit ribosomal protein S5